MCIRDRAAGSQLAAAMLLAAPAVAAWPATPPGARAWAAAALLALLCTGLAYILYFRLIARVGPARAISVTFLIPAFAALWGFVVLGEVPTVEMLAGCAVILLGTAPVSYTHLRAHETVLDLVCRLLLEKKQNATKRKSSARTVPDTPVDS